MGKRVRKRIGKIDLVARIVRDFSKAMGDNYDRFIYTPITGQTRDNLIIKYNWYQKLKEKLQKIKNRLDLLWEVLKGDHDCNMSCDHEDF